MRLPEQEYREPEISLAVRRGQSFLYKVCETDGLAHYVCAHVTARTPGLWDILGRLYNLRGPDVEVRRMSRARMFKSYVGGEFVAAGAKGKVLRVALEVLLEE